MNKVLASIIGLSRFLFVLLLLLAAFAFAMFQGGQVSWTIFYIVFPFALYSITLFFYPLSDFRAERHFQALHVQTGERLAVRLILRRRFRFPLLYVSVSERLREEDRLLKERTPKQVFVFRFQKELTWTYEMEQLPRGEYLFEGVDIEVVDFFGWMRKKQFIPVKSPVMVYPNTSYINLGPFRGQREGGRAKSGFNRANNTTTLAGVRDYQAGDRMSWIHWKSLARTQALMTKEFEERKSQSMLLVLDCRPSQTFEAQVELTASILQAASRQFVPIGFMTTGSEGKKFPQMEKKEQFQSAFVHLTKIRPSAKATFRFPNLQRRGVRLAENIVLITRDLNGEVLEAIISSTNNVRSVLCFVIAQDGQSLHSEVLEEIQRARRRGMKVHVLTEEQFSTAFEGVVRI